MPSCCILCGTITIKNDILVDENPVVVFNIPFEIHGPVLLYVGLYGLVE